MIFLHRRFNLRQKTILMCPGPVMLSKKVRRAALVPMSHREPEFSAVIDSIASNIKPIVGLKVDDKSYETLLISGSSTTAIEAVLSNFSKLGPILVVSNGEFGERLVYLAKHHTDQVDHLRFDWKEKINLKKVAGKLKTKQYSVLAVVHHETSTGLLNPIKELAMLAHENGSLAFIDTVSSIGAEQILAKEWDIDVLVGASGKALSAQPGVGIVIAKSQVLDKLPKTCSKSHYLNLLNYRKYMSLARQTPNTPVVSSFLSLEASLREINSLGVDRFQARVLKRAEQTRNALLNVGFGFLDYGKATSSVLTCISVPPTVDLEQIQSAFKKAGITVYHGKGPIQNEIFQIGHIGALRPKHVKKSIRVLEKIAQSKEIAGWNVKLKQHISSAFHHA